MTAVPRDDGQCFGRTFACSSVGSHEYHRTVPYPPATHFAIVEVERPDSPAGLILFDCNVVGQWHDDPEHDPGRAVMRYAVQIGMVDHDDTTICVLSAGPCRITGKLVPPPVMGDTIESHGLVVEATEPWFVADATPKSWAAERADQPNSPREDPPS